MPSPTLPPAYTVHRAPRPPELQGLFDGPTWTCADTAAITHFHPESSDHHPVARAKALYDHRALYLLYDVQDQYVRCTHTHYQDLVCKDSCVEFFVKPANSKGYFNFEFNCGGTLLLFHVTNPERIGSYLKEFTKVPTTLADQIRIHHSLPKTIDPERNSKTHWTLEAHIPWTVLSPHAAPPHPGDTWTCNFYKCGDETSHPHWASWSPIGPALNFHQPDRFGELHFAR